jgi:uncharacterized membrane protein
MSASKAGNHTSGVPSKAAIGGHPIHPVLIPFPIAFLIGAFLTDLAYWLTGDPFWARGSFWLVGAGLVGGLLAAVFGLIDFFSIGRAREHLVGWIHFLGNATVLILALASLVVRWAEPTAAVLPWGLVLSAAIASILVVTGWIGGELTFRHMIGVTGHGPSGESQEHGAHEGH